MSRIFLRAPRFSGPRQAEEARRCPGPQFGILFTILAIWLALLGSGCGAENADPEARDASAAPATDYPAAPNFQLVTLEGEKTVSLEGLAGKTVILDFWATWCPPCEQQVPELNAVYAEYREAEQVVLFGVSVDHGEVEAVREWVAEQGVDYPILLGGDDLARELGTVGYPTLYVIGPDGSLRERHVGVIAAEELETSIRGITASTL